MDDERRARRREKARLRNKERCENEPGYHAAKLAKGKAWYDANKADITARKRARYATDPEYRVSQRIHRLRSKYGISRDDFASMLDRQHHACGICEKPF